MTAGETHWAIEASFRIERARLIAGLACVVRNVDLAEELAQDALDWTGAYLSPGCVPVTYPGVYLSPARVRTMNLRLDTFDWSPLVSPAALAEKAV